MPQAPSHYHLCPLCGYEFRDSDTGCHAGCPMSKHCNLIKCPNCQYEFPAHPETLGWLRRFFRREPRPVCRQKMLTLGDLQEGESVELVCLNSEHASRRNSLAVYGLVPGCRLTLLQKRPSFVIRVGETELALEDSIAREICVKRVTEQRVVEHG